jgi:uncharacterized radical SAM superfamily protein
MIPIEAVRPKGFRSLLLSGGCDGQGRVPVLAKLELVEELKHKHPSLRLNWHVGLIDEEDTVEAIAPLADVISFELVGDEETIAEVYGLAAPVEDYLASYRMLRCHTRVVPHITLGLRGGALSGEYRALEALGEEGVEELVVLVFRPTRGTRYGGCAPPSLGEVSEFLVRARVSFPEAAIVLGCMRPGGAYRAELDRRALLVGVDGIVQPSPVAVDLASELGLTVARREECCAFA